MGWRLSEVHRVNHVLAREREHSGQHVGADAGEEPDKGQGCDREPVLLGFRARITYMQMYFAHSYDDKPYSQRAAAKDRGEVEMYSPLTR